MKVFATIAGVAGLLMMAAGAQAEVNMLNNGSLEPAVQFSSNTMPITVGTGSKALPGWTISAGHVDIVPDNYFDASNGNFSVDMIGSPGLGTITQKVTTLKNNSYTLTFDFSVNPEFGKLIDERSDTKVLEVDILGANGTRVLASHTYDGSSSAVNPLAVTSNITIGTPLSYSSESLSFIADGTSIKVKVFAKSPLNLPHGLKASSAFTGPIVDNFILTQSSGSPSPEPASLAILGLGGIALVARRRRGQ